MPKRDILVQEAMQGAQAMMQDYGALLQDPTFLSATKLLSGQPTTFGSSSGAPGIGGLPGQGQSSAAVKSVLPGFSSTPNEQVLSQAGTADRKLGSALESLIPDPAIYKFETGTGFEIRPVIQPDGHSVVYDFDYMYTTNVREPVRADEKHLGRVKRHFIHTQVQTSSFELREISRYQVALKASRTRRGVPLLEDVPVAGWLFRPLPSDESSLQQNIILAHCTVYPTLFDIMGLRWSKHVADLNHISLRDTEHVTRGRHQTIRDFIFDEASRRVDGFLDIENEEHDRQHLRPDLYHRRRVPSPYHPGGYTAPGVDDPTRRDFLRRDSRPEEYRDPPFDPQHGGPLEYYQDGKTMIELPPPVGRQTTSPPAEIELQEYRKIRSPSHQQPPADRNRDSAATRRNAVSKERPAHRDTTPAKPKRANWLKRLFRR